MAKNISGGNIEAMPKLVSGQDNAGKPKKVLFLITKATWGGAQRYVYDLATHVDRNKFEPCVAYGTAGKLSDDLQKAGIKTYAIRSLGRDIALVSDIASFFQIIRCIKNVRPDVLHLNSSKAAALGALAGRLCGVPRIIFTVHGWPFKEDRNGVARGLIRFISWFTAALSHAVIVVSKEDFGLGKQMPFCSAKMHLIYNGIEFPLKFGSGDIIRRAFPASARITGTVGELNRNKNQIALIEEARENARMYVAIVGEGELRSTLEEKIKEYNLGNRVKLFGFLPATKVLKGFDVFALPSKKEGLPYVLIEARVAGLPIVAGRVGGVADILDAPNVQEFSLSKMLGETTSFYSK